MRVTENGPRLLRLLCCLLAVSTIFPRAAHGQIAPRCEQAVLTLSEAAALLRVEVADLERLAEGGLVPGRRIGSTWRFNCEALLAWLANSTEPLTPLSRRPLSPSELSSVAGTGMGSIQPDAPQEDAPPPGATQQKPVGEAPRERLAEDISLRNQRVLLGQGDVVVDFGQFYARRDDLLLAVTPDGAGLAEARQQVFTTLLQARIGIFNETELFAGATFNQLENRVTFGGVTLTGNQQAELGGGTLGVRRTVLREGARRPSIIATFSGLIPTGERPYVVGGGVVLIKSVDPAALFLNVNYFRALRQRSARESVPGIDDSVDVAAGYALAVNDTLALSMAVTGLFRGTANRDDARFLKTDAFSLRFGVTSWLARGLYIEPSVTFSLGGPSRSFAFGVTLPYAF